MVNPFRATICRDQDGALLKGWRRFSPEQRQEIFNMSKTQVHRLAGISIRKEMKPILAPELAKIADRARDMIADTNFFNQVLKEMCEE